MSYIYDVLTIGRSSIDLYANEIGAPFVKIRSFNAYVGGCPANIAVAAGRLGLRTAFLTATSDDYVGDFVLNFLRREGIACEFSPRKAGRRTSAFLLGIEPPDRFSLVPYRDNCADLELTIDDVKRAPIAESRALLITGSGLSRQPSRDATAYAAETARGHGAKVILDLDLRRELRRNLSEFSAEIKSILPLVNVVVGTLEETKAAVTEASDKESFVDEGFDNKESVIDESVEEKASAVDDKKSVGDELDNLSSGSLLRKKVDALIAASNLEAFVIKRGAESTFICLPNSETVEAETFPIEVLNVLGAGDAFMGGFLYGYLKNWDWRRAARMGNACGAIVVTRHGCANFMPTEEEVLRFIENRGGF